MASYSLLLQVAPQCELYIFRHAHIFVLTGQGEGGAIYSVYGIMWLFSRINEPNTVSSNLYKFMLCIFSNPERRSDQAFGAVVLGKDRAVHSCGSYVILGC